MIELVFILLLVLAALIVSGLFFKGEVWSPTVTLLGKRVKISIAVPQVAFSIVSVVPAPAPAKVTPVEQAPPAPPSAK